MAGTGKQLLGCPELSDRKWSGALEQQGGPFAHKGLQNGMSSRPSAATNQSHSVS